MRIDRVMARAYSAPERMDDLVAFYEKLFGQKCEIRFPIPALGLEIASVGGMHLMAGTDDNLKPFRAAQATYWVDSVSAAAEELRRAGGEVLLGPNTGASGSFMVAKHPDGLVVEYIDRRRVDE